ncbi:hypothetical protein [Brevundimonas sp. R86498]|uniref:hypothetical protein n=1 Tax=Brevundimonas sp. R86498 TaxID=3093845 RepID=UPI0037C86314
MTTLGPEVRTPSGRTQILHVVLAAVAALIIAVASQGWPESPSRCDGAACDEA